MKRSNEKYRKIAISLGIFLSVISCIFTCQLLLKFADTGMSKLIFVAMGIGVQAMQTVVISISAYCLFQGQVGRGLPALAIYFLLLILSFAGTIGSLSSENKEINDLAKIESPEYQTYSGQIADIDVQIEFLRKTIEDCGKRSIISKCVVPKTKELNGLMEEKKDLQSKLLNINSSYSGDELFRRLSEFLGCTADQAKSLIYLLYSFALDLGAACLLAYSAGLLAFQEKDIWERARIQTEYMEKHLEAERRRLLSGVPERSENTDIPKHPEPSGVFRIPKQSEPVRTRPNPSGMPEPAMANLNPSERVREHSTVERFQMGSEPVRIPSEHPNLSEPSEGVRNRPEPSETLKKKMGFINEQIQKQAGLVEYLKTAYAGADPRGFLLGRHRIQEKTGLSVNECNAFHRKLKAAGIVDVRGSKTFPVYPEQQALEKLREII
ncbi:MAG: hypothetical protein V2I97_24100 [Desulfococcaceae bacterium]|jgi:hypothetical protein|nr:hypothetical protein [Desulfococcaceae bacterium]